MKRDISYAFTYYQAESVSGSAHKVLMSNGFEPADAASEVAIYEHPRKGGVHIYRDGSWTHTSVSGKSKSGNGLEELRSHLFCLVDDDDLTTGTQ